MLQFFPGLVPDRISDLSPSSHHHPDGPEPQTAPSTHMQPHADSALAALWEEAVGAAKAAAAAVVQALQRARAGLHRLGTDGGASDGSDNLPDEEIKGGSAGSSGSIRGGAARRLGAGQSTVSKKKHTDDDGDKDGDDDDVCSVPDAGDECYYGLGDGSCKPWCVFPLLARVKLGLGDINDKVRLCGALLCRRQVVCSLHYSQNVTIRRALGLHVAVAMKRASFAAWQHAHCTAQHLPCLKPWSIHTHPI